MTRTGSTERQRVKRSVTALVIGLPIGAGRNRVVVPARHRQHLGLG